MLPRLGRTRPWPVKNCPDLSRLHIGTANTTKRVFVEAAGGRHVPAGPGAADRVRQAAPNGVNALFDLVGGQALSDLAPLVGDKTRIISGADSKTVAELGGNSIKRARTAEVLSEVVGLVRDGVLDPFVTAVLPLLRPAWRCAW